MVCDARSVSEQTDAAARRTPELVLREPRERVSPRAKGMWRVASIPVLVLMLVGLVVVLVVGEAPAALALVPGVLVLTEVAYIVFVPAIRYRVHRWEVTHEAFYTQSGWLTRDVRIVPLNRVQTVDSSQGALERLFGLASVRVTTASGSGTAFVHGLEEDLAKRVVADLVRDTAAVAGDAT